MVRGRGYSSRGGYRGSNRGNSSWNGSSRGYPSSFSSSIDSRSKYTSDRFNSRSSYNDDYHKSYRSESSYLERDNRRSPERKRMRTEASSSRYESSYGGYGSSRPEPPPPPTISDRYSRGYSPERHTSSTPYSSRREEYRSRPSRPSRGSYRGRISTRGSRGLRYRERPIRRRLVDTSYLIRKRALARPTIYSRKLKLTRIRSAIAKKKESTNDSDAEKTKETDKTEDGNEDAVLKKESEDKAEDDNAEGESLEDKLKRMKTFVKLVCPHCNIKVLTFYRYEKHLSSRTHLFTMKKVAIKQKSILAQMRAAQRNTQNELEKNSEELSEKSNFCPLCKLNYKQKKAVHQLSEAHKNMKKFLMPTCKTCDIQFKSPMSYESHLSSIKHLKRKQRLENAGNESGDEDNLENFTTIDSVGDGDGGSDTVEKEDSKEIINVGIEKVRKVEVYYCDLCKMYLPRGDENEMVDILSKHCKLKVHMKRYIRVKEIERKAEKALKEEKKEATSANSIKEKADNSKLEDDDAREEKIWADVDKDLGDILAEAESANKSSDEDEEDSHVNGERYDRFKLSIDGASESKDNEEK